ncbi:hypothetical protein AVEN_85986-1 [Araneus ventricosus]|uniref:Ionotropic glutamate receptor L-glutamate and glycine-binding domain-containing protein n=1 Tax=Araneus ventricosus TaxID=182803 RepID=A0A4Y2PU61_ARAVE|nr:hypothetical protein AVEN_85986-1 [Araneus ventricosus]
MFLDALETEYDVVVPKDDLFGILLPNGSWSGMVHKGEADLAFTYISITEERAKVVNFSTYYTTEVCVFVTHMPEIIKSAFSFLYPFDLATWMAILLTLSLVAKNKSGEFKHLLYNRGLSYMYARNYKINVSFIYMDIYTFDSQHHGHFV